MSKQKGANIKTNIFYTENLPIEKEGSLFFVEYNVLLKTIESVNNFNNLYKGKRAGARGGATHNQQDLYRAMLVFACAGLDVFVKLLVKNKLSQLIKNDVKAEEKFKEFVGSEIKKDDKKTLDMVALALINNNPRDVFLDKYILSMTESSLQSVEQLMKVSEVSGLDTKKIFSDKNKERIERAFRVRNEIIHEMDINIDQSPSKTTAYRTRRQRVAKEMETNTKSILKLAENIFLAYKTQFKKYLIIDFEKKPSPPQNPAQNDK